MFESFSVYRVHKKILYAELSPGNRSDGQQTPFHRWCKL